MLLTLYASTEVCADTDGYAISLAIICFTSFVVFFFSFPFNMLTC